MNIDPAMMEFLDTVRNDEDDPQRELRARAAGAVHARRQGLARRRQLHAGRHRRRSRAPSPAGTTTRAAAFFDSTTSTTTTDRLSRARAEGDLQDRPAASAPAASSFAGATARARPRSTRHRHHLRAHGQPRGRTRWRAARRAGCSSTSRTPTRALDVRRRRGRRLRASTSTWTSRALLHAIFVHDDFYLSRGAARRRRRRQKSVQVAGRLRREHAAPARHEARRARTSTIVRRQLQPDPRSPEQHGPGPLRSAERLRLGLGDGAGSAARRCSRATASPATSLGARRWRLGSGPRSSMDLDLTRSAATSSTR